MARPGFSLFPLLLAGLVGALFGFSCGGTGASDTPVPTTSPRDTPAPTPSPRDTLMRAVDELLRLRSASFTLEHHTGTTTLFPGIVTRKAYGVVDIPDKFSLTVEAESAFPRSYVEIDIVAIEGRAYMTDVLTGDWRQVAPEILPFTFVGLNRSLAEIIEAVDSPVLIGPDTLKGRDVQRINGLVLSEDLIGIVPVAAEGFEVELDLWVDPDSGRLAQILISGKVVPTDQEGTVRVLTLDDVDVPVEISPPR